MVAPRQPVLNVSDKEDLGDAKLLLGTAAGNLRAALVGDELSDALLNAERQTEQALLAIRRVREHVVGEKVVGEKVVGENVVGEKVVGAE
jgi:hypothetical protein